MNKTIAYKITLPFYAAIVIDMFWTQMHSSNLWYEVSMESVIIFIFYTHITDLHWQCHTQNCFGYTS